jgi:hypothetical protein
MDSPKTVKDEEKYPSGGLKATLEKNYIEEYLLSKGYRRKDLGMLPKEEARQLLIEASRFASLKLTDIESRSRFRDTFHRSP